MSVLRGLVGFRGEPDFSLQGLKDVQLQGANSRVGIIARHEEESEGVNETAGQGGDEEVRPTVHLEKETRCDEHSGCRKGQQTWLYATLEQIAAQRQIQDLAQMPGNENQAG